MTAAPADAEPETEPPDELVVTQLGGLADRTEVSYFEAGHMMYVHEPSRLEQSARLAEFVPGSGTARAGRPYSSSEVSSTAHRK